MILPYANLKVNHWNPGATMPLVLPVNVVCNVDETLIHDNIRANSLAPWPWLVDAPAHDRVALLCGSGPSLKESLAEIHAAQTGGAVVFAMNGAAKFLADNGILADYQVLVDARPETAQLVGFARRHLVASQCAPETFAAAAARHAHPNTKVILWHLGIEPLDDFLPDDPKSHVLIGGSSSVGNTATCIAYAMGYRALHLYGYDSSWRRTDTGVAQHAFHQKMNDGDPSCIVNYRGIEYQTSLTMKLQAERFQDTARDLQDMGCDIHVHGDGLLPAIWHAPKGTMSEVEKYRAMWSFDGYRTVSPGEHHAATFCSVVHLPANATLVDFGCGTGRGALAIVRATGCAAVLVDFAENCRDPEAQDLPFVRADLSCDRLPVGDVGYCSDVMEHIPPHQVDTVLRNIMACVPSAFFNIDFAEDICGAMIGERLHLSIHPYEWWLERFNGLGYRVEWSEHDGRSGRFYVTH